MADKVDEADREADKANMNVKLLVRANYCKKLASLFLAVGLTVVNILLVLKMLFKF